MSVRAQLEAAESAALAGGATLLSLSTEVRIGGVIQPACLGWTIEHGLDIINSTASLTFAQRPAQAEELAPVEIWAGYNGYLVLCFAGEVVAPAWDYAPATATVDCRAKLARVRANWGGDDQLWSSIDDAALIVAILELYGISNHNIESSGWTLGALQDIELKNGDSGWSLIEEIDRLSGYVTFSAPDGWTHRRRVSGAPGSGYVWRYEKGKNILQAKRTRSLDGIYNKAVVRGLEYEGVSVEGTASAVNAYIPPTPGYIPQEETSDLVEDDTKATEIAQRIVGDLNRRPEAMDLTVAGNPLLQPGMTIQVEHSDLETGVAQLFIQHISHSLSGAEFTTQINTTGGTLSGYNASAPVVQFEVQIFREFDTGAGAAVYVLVATSTSFDPDGDEGAMTLAWTIAGTGGTPDPLTGSGPVFRTVLPGTTTSVTITLAATDVDSLMATQSRGIPIDEEALRYDTIYFAAGTLAGVSSDGEQTWQTQTIPGGATTSALAPFAGTWGQMWLAGDGHAYGTFDNLMSPLVDFGQPFGTSDELTSGWIHELDDTRLWVANSAGLVAFGSLGIAAQTVAWTVVTAISEGPVKEIRESYGFFGGLRATAGQGYYSSEDGGGSWNQLDTGDTAWRMAAGRDLNLYSFLNDADPLRDEGGVAFTWPVLVPVVEHVRGITIGWRVDEVYAADDQARLFSGPTGTNPIVMTHVTDNASGINHLLRSGTIDGKIYAAADDGIYAWMPATTYLAQIYASGSPVQMLGYNTLRLPPPVTGQVLVAGKGGVWLWDGITWTYLPFGIPALAAVPFAQVVADPNNQDRWMAVALDYPARDGSNKLIINGTSISPILETEDRGLTWHEIEMTGVTAGAWASFVTVRVAYDVATPGQRHIVMWLGVSDHLLYWRGSGTNLGTEADLGVFSLLRLHGIDAILGGDLLISINANGPDSGIQRVAAGTLALATLPGGSGFEETRGVEWLKGASGLSPAAVAVHWDAFTSDWTLYASPDGRQFPETPRLGPTTEALQGVTTTLEYAFLATDTLIKRVANVLGTPVVTTVYTLASGTISGAPRAGRRLRTAIAVPLSTNRTLISADGGSSWGIVAPPATYPDLTALDYWGGLEVLEVGG